MAILTRYMTNTLTSGWQTCSDTAPTAGYASPVVGWIVGQTAPVNSNRFSYFQAATERAESTFGNVVGAPDGTLDTTLKDALLVDANPLNGNFASGNWTINGVVRANTNGGAQDGRLLYYLISADDLSGTNAAVISTSQVGATLTNVSNSADFDSSVTFNPGAFALTNKYLFVQLGWDRTGAGGMSTADVNIRIGSTGTRVVTADFTESRSGSLTQTLADVTSSGSGKVSVSGSATNTIDTVSVSASSTVLVTGTSASTIAAISLSAEGTVANAGTSGTLASTLDAITSSLAGTNLTHGSTSATLDAITSSSAGTNLTHGSTSATVDAITSSSAGTNLTHGSTSATVDAITSSSAGTTQLVGALNQSVGLVTSVAVGAVRVAGALTQSIGDVLLSASTSQASIGTLAQPIGDVALIAVGRVAVNSTASPIVGEVTPAASATVRVSGSSATIISPITASGGGSVAVFGDLARVLNVALSSDGDVVISAELTRTIGDVSLAAIGSGQSINNGVLTSNIGDIVTVDAQFLHLLMPLGASTAINGTITSSSSFNAGTSSKITAQLIS